MLSRRLFPDTFLFPSLVKACSGLASVQLGKQLHAFSCSFGFCLDSFVQSSLLHMYLKCDRVRDAHKVFDGMPLRDLVSWSALISGYSSRGCVDEATGLFNEMRATGLEPNAVTWNGMISGFSCNGLCSEAVLMFQKMHSEGFPPDGSSVSSVFPAIGSLEDLKAGIQVHAYVVKQGFGLDKCVASALIDMYGKCSCALDMSRVFYGMEQLDVGTFNAFVTGMDVLTDADIIELFLMRLSRNGFVEDALEVFKNFKGQQQGLELNTISWTSVIACCSQNGKDMEALELFRVMQLEGVKPNSVTIPCLLPACGNIAALAHGKAAHCFSLRSGIFDNVYVGSALVDMYANCGRLNLSRLCFDQLSVKNLVCWNAMMSGYATHGKLKETVEIFHMMQRCGHRPDHISFTCVLSACSQNGLIDEGWHYFTSMSKEHGIKPKLEHYACMVTLLGRAGKLEEAYSLINKMPIEPDACVWGSFLSSCRVHNNVGLGETAAEKLFVLEPRNPGNYVILSNIYASKGLWSQVDRVRDTMNLMGLRKNPGCSWIEVKNKVYMLLAGDNSHPQRSQIIEKLNKLSMEMKNSGLFPNFNFVLQDVEEQDKEQILCGHSEKLAVAFGLLNTPPGSSLSVIKNLRICGDCHAVIKFISGFERREIFVRDTNRFHHFKDGECSCGDFW